MTAYVATPLGEIGVSGRRTCDWPECETLADAHGFCRRHGIRLSRGGELGSESAWDRLVRAALAVADAETDEEYDAAASRLKAAAKMYRTAGRRPTAPAAASSSQVERDVERARARLAARGIHVETR